MVIGVDIFLCQHLMLIFNGQQVGFLDELAKASYWSLKSCFVTTNFNMMIFQIFENIKWYYVWFTWLNHMLPLSYKLFITSYQKLDGTKNNQLGNTQNRSCI
jgi:hypothetical protein